MYLGDLETSKYKKWKVLFTGDVPCPPNPITKRTSASAVAEGTHKTSTVASDGTETMACTEVTAPNSHYGYSNAGVTTGNMSEAGE